MIVEAIQENYLSDLGPLLALSEEQFNARASKRDWTTANDPRGKSTGGGGGGGGGFNYGGGGGGGGGNLRRGTGVPAAPGAGA